jgi:hypothetical protein
MIENVVNKMGGVGMYGVISICLFFAVFLGVLLWALRLKKSYLSAMSELPLEGSSGSEPGADLPAKPENQHD